MIIITLSELIWLGLLVFFIIYITISYIIEKYQEKSKKWKDCGKCKFYYLKKVASCGDCCWYGCKLKNDINDIVDGGNGIKYRKCNDYKEN